MQDIDCYAELMGAISAKDVYTFREQLQTISGEDNSQQNNCIQEYGIRNSLNPDLEGSRIRFAGPVC